MTQGTVSARYGNREGNGTLRLKFLRPVRRISLSLHCYLCLTVFVDSRRLYGCWRARGHSFPHPWPARYVIASPRLAGPASDCSLLGSAQQRVAIGIDQSNDFYKFVPGPASPFDTTFTVVLSGAVLEFRSAYAFPVRFVFRFC